MIEIARVLHTPCPLDAAADHLCDVALRASWDPHTAAARRVGGDVGIRLGVHYDIVRRLGPWRHTRSYTVVAFTPCASLMLRSSSRLLVTEEALTFAAGPAGAGRADGTTIALTTRVRLRGPLTLLVPAVRWYVRAAVDDRVAGLSRSLVEVNERIQRGTTQA